MPSSVRCNRYVVVEAETSVKIKAKSNIHRIEGRGTGLTGYLEAAFCGDGLEKDSGVNMHLEIPVEKLDSKNEAQDREMRKLVGSRSFPKIVLDSNAVSPTPLPNQYHVSGTVMIRGSTKPFDGIMFMRQRDGRVELVGERTVDIRAFGIAPPRILAFQVHPEVQVRLHVVAMLEE